MNTETVSGPPVSETREYWMSHTGSPEWVPTSWVQNDSDWMVGFE